MKEKISLRQLLVLAAMGLTSAALRILPGESAAAAGGEGGWLSPLIALPAVLLLCRVLWDLLRHAPEEGGLGEVYCDRLGQNGGKAVLLLYIIWMLLILGMGLVQCGERLGAVGFGRERRAVFLAAVLILTGRAAMGKLTAFARTMEICFLLLAVMLGMVLLLTAFRVNPGNLLPVRGNLLSGSLPVLKTACAGVPTFFLLGETRKEDGEKGRKKTMRWLIAGMCVLLGIHAVCFGSYGWETVQMQRVPIYEAAKQAGIPGAFQRAEAVVAAMLVLSDGAMMGCTYYIIEALQKSMGAKEGTCRKLVPITGGIGAGIAYLAGRDPEIAARIGQKILPGAAFLLGICIPVLVWLLEKRNRGEVGRGISCGDEKGKTEDVVTGKENAKRNEKNGKKC